MKRRVAVLAVFVASVAVFWRTAYPTITWWDSSSYSLAAATLGIMAAPGSLLLTLIGWPVAKLAVNGSPAYTLNLFAGVLAALTAALVYVVAGRLLQLTRRDAPDQPPVVAHVGASIGALTFAFAATTWEHAIKFTPYVLTALFTGMILWTLVRWWKAADDPGAWRWLGLATLLFGLDFSVHRTNALLIPGAIAWILIRAPRTAIQPRAWLAAVAGLIAGLSLQLLLIPIARMTTSPLNMHPPTDWKSFRETVALADRGGGFLVDLFPRKADIWTVQLTDFLAVVGDNFLHHDTPVGPLGWLPIVAVAAGLVMLARRERRLGLAFSTMLLLHAALTVLYFNIPANFFRPFDRHYLPVFVTMGVAMAYAFAHLGERIAQPASARRRRVAFSLSIGVIPLAQLVGNWRTHDASRRYFARDYAVNALTTLPRGAIYFTVGDNDTFPIMYMQAVEGVRRDVTMINLALANADWYIDQIMAREPDFPITIRGASRPAFIEAPQPAPLVIPIDAGADELGLPSSATIPSSITLHPKPTAEMGIMIASEITQVDILRTNRWRRPITVSTTAGRSGLGWMASHARDDGLHWRILPVDSVETDMELLRTNLLERFQYRGYDDPSVRLEPETRTMGRLYYEALGSLIEADLEYSPTFMCREAVATMLAAIPPHRLEVPGLDAQTIERRCRVE